MTNSEEEKNNLTIRWEAEKERENITKFDRFFDAQHPHFDDMVCICIAQNVFRLTEPSE